MLQALHWCELYGGRLGMVPSRQLYMWSILLWMGIQWSALSSLSSLACVAAGIWNQDPLSSSMSPVNFTVVTAMFDIGRGKWNTEYARPYSEYLAFMALVMKLRVNIVAFTDYKAAAAIRRMRRNLQDRTWVVEMQLQDLPYFTLKDKIQDIMDSENYRRRNPLALLGHPEANVPEYDILMLSKLFFLVEASRLDLFNSSYFIWLDGGFGHGHDIFPRDGVWYPKNLLNNTDKITMIELSPGGAEAARKYAHRLHKLRGAVVSGGFLGGGKKALQKLFRLEQSVVFDWLKRGIIDDDQSCRLMAYYKDPSLFRLVEGDWWDVFKLFNRHR